MAITIIDQRITVNTGDNTTGWNTGSAVTQIFAEAPASIAAATNNDTVQIYHTGTARNLNNSLIYVYAFNNAIQETWLSTNPPLGLHIGDGSNRITVKQTGGDKRVFQHLEGPVEWQQLLVDTSQLSTLNDQGLVIARQGSLENLNLGALTQFGMDATTLSKALGGGFNTACDIIRVGNDGIRIIASDFFDLGNFEKVVEEDKSTEANKAHGVIREYSTGFYGCQAPVTIGGLSDTSSYFLQEGGTLIFENRFIGDDKYYFKIEGNTTSGLTYASLQDFTITTAGPGVSLSIATDDWDRLVLAITRSSFINLKNEITFPSTKTSFETSGNYVSRNVFQGCGRIDIGATRFFANTISNTTSPETGAVWISQLQDEESFFENTFISGEGGHGLYITEPGSYVFKKCIFSGYGDNDTTDAAIYNDSGGHVVITMVDSSIPTVRNGVGSTTEFTLTPVSLTLTNLAPNTEVRILEKGTQNELDGVENSGTEFTYNYFYPAPFNIDIIIHNLEYIYIKLRDIPLGPANSSIPIQQQRDRWARFE